MHGPMNVKFSDCLHSVLHSTNSVANFTKLQMGFTSNLLLESTVKVFEDCI